MKNEVNQESEHSPQAYLFVSCSVLVEELIRVSRPPTSSCPGFNSDACNAADR